MRSVTTFRPKLTLTLFCSTQLLFQDQMVLLNHSFVERVVRFSLTVGKIILRDGTRLVIPRSEFSRCPDKRLTIGSGHTYLLPASGSE